MEGVLSVDAMASGHTRAEPASVPVAPASLRLVTLNAHQGVGSLRRRRLLAGIREALRLSAADLVFLQEVGGDHGDAGPESHYEMLAEEVWPQHAYGRNAVAGSGHQGNALLSKHPIVEWSNVDISVGRAEPRGLLHCVVAAPGLDAPLHAVCVHLGLRESHRRVQLDRLVSLVAHTVPTRAPLVVAGDFNDWRETAHRRLIAEAGLVEAGAERGGRPPRTFPARWPLLRLDRIYVRHLSHQRVALPRQPWSVLSDHAPLGAEVSAERSDAGTSASLTASGSA